MKDEINLREYVNVVLSHWKVIMIIAVIAVLVGGLGSLFSPNIYEATARVLITRERSEIVFEPEYKTLLGEDATNSQRTGLIALLKSRTVASRVIELLGDKLKPEERDPASLLDTVQVREQGDLIEISVRANSPGTSAMIADAWAQSYEIFVNALYSEVLPQPKTFDSQAIVTSKEYREKQEAWEDFVSGNRIDELSQQIADVEVLYNLLSLREQMEAGSPSSASAAADSLAFILLQTQAYASQLPTSLPVGLQIKLDTASGLKLELDNIDRLISALETRSGITLGQPLSELPREILRLKGELEQENARRREIEASRDIAWEAYQTVAGKVVEAKVVALVPPSNVVRVADPAVVPVSPVGPNRIVNTVIALAAGLVVGLICAFGIEWLRRS